VNFVEKFVTSELLMMISFYYLAECTMFPHLPAPIWQFPMGFLAIFFFRWIGGWPAASTPQPGGPGDFCSRFSSSSPWYASIELQDSSASFGPPRVFYFPGTRHIWWAFPYPPPGGGARWKTSNSSRDDDKLLGWNINIGLSCDKQRTSNRPWYEGWPRSAHRET